MSLILKAIQVTFLIIGVTVLCAVASAFGLALLSVVTIFRRDPNQDGTGAWGSYFGVVACFVLGGFVGAVGGLIVALKLISDREFPPWRLPTWLGIVAGICASLMIRFNMEVNDRHGIISDPVRQYTIALLILATCTASLGGFLGHFVESTWLSTSTRNRRALR